VDRIRAALPSTNLSTLYHKSWTAYVGLFVLWLVLLAIVGLLAWGGFNWVAVAVSVPGILVLAYNSFLLKSVRLYFDDAGVWVYSGLFPWNKGVIGVRWRDLDEAVYFPTLWSWLFKSYSIRIGHRFTRSSEILLTHMAQGHEAVMAINSRHQELVRKNALD